MPKPKRPPPQNAPQNGEEVRNKYPPKKEDIINIIGLLEAGKIEDARKKIKLHGACSKNHMLLRHFMLLSSYKGKSTNEILEVIITEGDYEKKHPDLALKAYSLIGNGKKVEELVQKGADMHCTRITFRNCIADSIVEERPELIKSLAKLTNKLKKKPFMSSALVRACNLNLQQTLKASLQFKKELGITDDDLRDCAYHAIVRSNLQILKDVCNHANKSTLEDWKRHFETMHSQALQDPIKKKYTKEIAIVNNALTIKKLKTQNHDIWNIEI